MSTHPNPILDTSLAVPRFDRIEAEHVVPAITEVLARMDERLTALEAAPPATWEALASAMESIGDALHRAIGVVHHLMAVANTPALREAWESVQPEVVRFSMRLGQSRPLYDAAVEIRRRDGATLDATELRVLDAMIRDARNSGVGLDGEAREAFNALQVEQAELSTTFSNHVLDATKAWSMVLTHADEIAGLPPTFLEQASQAARARGHEASTPEAGPWAVTLDFPSYRAFLRYSDRRDLRERVHRAFIRRASEGEHDNGPVIRRLLQTRRREAELLGYPTYAALSLSTKMAQETSAARALLERLGEASRPAALREHEALTRFARERSGDPSLVLQRWDLTYWSEKEREAQFQWGEEEVRPWLPFERVLAGMFEWVGRLFGVRVRSADGEVPVWHPDVRFFRVFDRDDREIAAFFLDPFARPGTKRGGAWHGTCVGRSTRMGVEGVRLPISYLVCNQTPPVGGRPSLMTFDEVTTLFHEFGHGLQHMMTQVSEGLAAGMNGIEWDAVELPSTFLENWCHVPEVMRLISGHVETGATMPEDLAGRIIASRNHRAATMLLTQVQYSVVDLELHDTFDPDGDADPFAFEAEITTRLAVLPPLPEDRFLCAFAHIFAGGYAAGYYSYKWAEVLSADAFEAFEEVGLQSTSALAEVGARFARTVLALGGSVPPAEVYRAFRGRDPDPLALLRQVGLGA